MRCEPVQRILDLACALQAPGRGLSLDDIQRRYGVGRRTAERMRLTVQQLFPELRWEPGPDRKRYWKLRRGHANPLVVWTVGEIRALEAAVRWAREDGRPDREQALRSVTEKVKGLIGPVGVPARNATPSSRVVTPPLPAVERDAAPSLDEAPAPRRARGPTG